MAVPLIADGTYKIHNVGFPNFGVVLIDGDPFGVISAFTQGNNITQRWTLTNLGDNRITLESIASPGSYASSNAALQGVPLVGSDFPTNWTVESAGLNTFRVGTSTPEGQLVRWTLRAGNNHVAITLRPAEGNSAQWRFTAV